MYPSSVLEATLEPPRLHRIALTPTQDTVVEAPTIPDAIALPLMVLLILVLLHSSRNLSLMMHRSFQSGYQRYRLQLHRRRIRRLEQAFRRTSTSHKG